MLLLYKHLVIVHQRLLEEELKPMLNVIRRQFISKGLGSGRPSFR